MTPDQILGAALIVAGLGSWLLWGVLGLGDRG